MAYGQRSNTPVVPQAMRALDQLKYEVASELGITPPASGYWGMMTTRDTGSIGGNMTRKLVALAEQQLASGTGHMATMPATGARSQMSIH